MADAFTSCWVPITGAPYTGCFIDIFDALANDSLGIDAQYSAGDGIHLNDTGHARIFDVAEPVAHAYLCTATPCN